MKSNQVSAQVGSATDTKPSLSDPVSLSVLVACVVFILIFFPLTLSIGLLGSALPPVASPSFYLVLPFVPAIIFPFYAIPVTLLGLSASIVAARRGSVAALSIIAITIAIINGASIRFYLNYLATP